MQKQIIQKQIRSEFKQKILLALSTGVALGLSRSPDRYFKILNSAVKKWKDFERKRLYRAVREFYRDRLVDYREDDYGNVKIVLTKEGIEKALIFKLDEMEIKRPKKWDGLWRMVIFDIPEKNKKAREALRKKLQDFGFRELQKSVFVFPYECEDEINFITEVFQIRPHVRFVRAKDFTNEEQVRLDFGLH